MNNLLGVLIGAAIDRSDGEGGIKGAIGGYLAQAALRRIVPVVATLAVGWGVQYAARRALHAVTGDPALKRGADARA